MSLAVGEIAVGRPIIPPFGAAPPVGSRSVFPTIGSTPPRTFPYGLSMTA
jgi:hypothetical protein